MANRTRIGASDDKNKLDTRVENLLESELSTDAAFEGMTNAARWKLIRRTLVLLLRVAKRALK